MSSNNKTTGLILTLVGLVVAIIGIALYLMDKLDLIPSVVIILVGIVILALGAMMMYGIIGHCGCSAEKKEKPKAPKAEKAAAPKAKSGAGKSRAASVNLGDGKLAKAIKFGAAKIDSKVAEGKISDAQANAYMDKLMSYAPQVGKDEDSALIAVSQVLGSIAEA